MNHRARRCRELGKLYRTPWFERLRSSCTAPHHSPGIVHGKGNRRSPVYIGQRGESITLGTRRRRNAHRNQAHSDTECRPECFETQHGTSSNACYGIESRFGRIVGVVTGCRVLTIVKTDWGTSEKTSIQITHPMARHETEILGFSSAEQ